MSLRRGFSLIELLLAVTLSVLLIGAVLAVLSGLAREAAHTTSSDRSDARDSVKDLLAWDLANARTMIEAPDGSMLVLVGHGAIARSSRTPTGRLVRVTYRCEKREGQSWLVRQQQTLDDPARPQTWSELVAGGVTSIEVIATDPQNPADDPQATADESADLPLAVRAGAMQSVPARVRLRISGLAFSFDEQLTLK
jgi:type II secretory pathway component PulJ